AARSSTRVRPVQPPPSRSSLETPLEPPSPTRSQPALPPDASVSSLSSAGPDDPAVDPQLSVPASWHSPEATDAPTEGPEVPDAPGSSTPNSVLWKKVKRNLLFWQGSSDLVHVSVFGPAAVPPGQTVNLTVYVHTPDDAANVRTLARAFDHDAELISTGHLTREVARAVELAGPLGVGHDGGGKSLLE